MPQIHDKVVCSGNGFAFLRNRSGKCTCHACYWGLNCEYVLPSKCGGTIKILPVDYFSNIEKCKCSYDRSGPCCEKKKCSGSNPIPDQETGKCNCDLKSGDNCEKIKCINGGTTLKNGDCDCRKYFTGKFCETIRCLNHEWFVESKSKCQCQRRFSGTHCQIVECEHGGRQDPSGDKCTDCSFVFTGDYCHEVHAIIVAMVVVPTLVMLVIVSIAIRSYLSKKEYSGTPSGDRSPPHLRNVDERNPGSYRFGNTAHLRRFNGENFYLQHHPISNDLGINNLGNNLEINFLSNWDSQNAATTNQTVNHPIGYQDRPPSYDDPPSYEEVVKNMPYTIEIV